MYKQYLMKGKKKLNKKVMQLAVVLAIYFHLWINAALANDPYITVAK